LRKQALRLVAELREAAEAMDDEQVPEKGE
jgi:hypothetical protein